MKKLFYFLAIGMLLVCCLFNFVSCASAKPELDLEAAKKALEDRGYTVELREVYPDDGIEETLSAHSGDDTIEIIVCKDATIAKHYYELIKSSYDAELKSVESPLKIYKRLFKVYPDDFDSDDIEMFEDDIQDLTKELKDLKEDYAIGRKGNIVWCGTINAIEDTKQ